MAIGYSEDPCPVELQISWLPIIIGIVIGSLVVLVACVFLVRWLCCVRREWGDDDSYTEEYSEDGSRQVRYYRVWEFGCRIRDEGCGFRI